MIHVDRSRVAIPEVLTSEHAEKARADLKEYFAIERVKRGQTRFPFKQDLWQDTRHALHELFNYKCAYCEKPVTYKESIVDHFRPISDAIGLDGEVSKDGYWWLAYEWDNLYLACQECVSAKSTRFPVVIPAHDIGKNLSEDEQPVWRAARGATGSELHAERALLIDPCYDQPERYIEYMPDGMITALDTADQNLTQPEGLNRGQITIEIFGLNRRELVADRGELTNKLMVQWKQLSESTLETDESKMALASLLEAIDDATSYTGTARNWLVRVMNKALEDPTTRSAKFLDLASPLAEKLGLNKSKQIESFTILENLAVDDHALVQTSPPAPVKPKKKQQASQGKTPSLGSSTATIQRIEISNYKAITHLTLELARAVPAEVLLGPEAAAQSFTTTTLMAPWTVLLGENGAGKSTVLQAVALALVGRPLVEQYKLRPKKILHRSADGTAPKGYVKVWLSDQPQKPVQARFDAQGFSFRNSRATENLYVRGYGSTRLLPNDEERKPPANVPPKIDVENLFDPFDPLFDAEKWLPNLEETHFDTIALAYKDILGLKDLAVKESTGYAILKTIERKGEHITVRDPFDVPVSLDELSDGYQSVLALATDIIAGLSDQQADYRNAHGIILIDEIGANLHPRWRMTFVKSLRLAFPRMQFLVTTHEPLCLRGLEYDEVVVMSRQDKEVTALYNTKEKPDVLPSPKRMRAGQLLTSRFFGLYSTIDPDVDRDFQTYYDLLVRQANGALETDQQALLQTLKERLRNTGSMILGNNRRDQMVYELIDDYLAQELEKGPQKVTDLKTNTREQVFKIWERARLFTGRDSGAERPGNA